MTQSAEPFAYLAMEHSIQERGWVPLLSLLVQTWPSAIPDAGLKDVKLTLYECDFSEADPEASERVAPTSKRKIAELKLDLVPNQEAAREGKPKPQAAPARVKLEWSTWEDASVKKTYAHSKQAQRHYCDFVFATDQKNIPLRVPGDGETLHDEGLVYEIGMVLEHASLAAPYERLDSARVARIPGDTVKVVRALFRHPRGAESTAHGGPWEETKEIGRFNDPDRLPANTRPVQPGEVHMRLDLETLWAILTHDATVGPAKFNVDGMRFGAFVKPSVRRETIERLAASITLNPELGPGQTNERLGTSDIQKAFFVVHDVGAGAADRSGAFYASGRATRRNGVDVRSRGVHGFLNQDGSYAPSTEFGAAKSSGTKYEGTKMGSWAKPYFLNFETAPLVESTLAEGEEDTFACVGADAKLYYKWPHALLDCMADLYVLASARANHLLTVTCHLEADRNLVLSKGFYVYDKETLQKAGGSLKKGAHYPRSMHDDPRGIDMQVLYDKITERLNALGGIKLPKGVRYGMHPQRVFKGAKKNARGIRLRQSGGVGERHSFPWQSAARYATTTAAQKTQADDWVAKDGKPKFKTKKVGKKKKKVVVGYRPGPWWHEDFVEGESVYTVEARDYPYAKGLPPKDEDT